MWIFTPFGFFSIVQRKGEDVLTVRARAKVDLDRLRDRYLASLSATVETPQADYPYRATAKPKELAQAVRRIVEDIDYPNFKDEVFRELGPERERLCHEVWAVMQGATSIERRPRTRRKP